MTFNLWEQFHFEDQFHRFLKAKLRNSKFVSESWVHCNTMAWQTNQDFVIRKKFDRIQNCFSVFIRDTENVVVPLRAFLPILSKLIYS